MSQVQPANCHSAAPPMFLAGEMSPALDLPFDPFPPDLEIGVPGVVVIRLASKPKPGDRMDLVAEIDARDWWMVRQRQWWVLRTPAPRTYYAQAGQPRAGDHVSLHTAVTGFAQTDHIDGNGLNNRRVNLRPASKSQNGANRCAQINNTSGYRGVVWHKRDQKWLAQIKVAQRNIYLGLFADKDDAARAYNIAAVKYFGDYASLNIIPDPEAC